MTEKRFKHMKNRLGMQFIGYDEKYVLLGTFADAEGVKYTVDLLNQLNDENKQLRNKKERYKRLSEIRQQQIDNRILTIKDFINNCSDNKVRSVLKELFYSEVNEYDLSLEKRKLLNENEQLKADKQALIDFIRKEFPKSHKHILEGFE